MNDKTQSNAQNAPPNEATTGSMGGPNGSRDAAIALRSTVTEGVREVGSEVKHLASDVAVQAGRTAKSQLAAQKDRAAEGLGGVAHALRLTGRQLESRDELGVTGLIDRAADSVDAVAWYLRDRSFGELARDVERFARREPALFLGGAFVAGLIGGRFLKSSRGRREEISRDDIERESNDALPKVEGDGFDAPRSGRREEQSAKPSSSRAPSENRNSASPSSSSRTTEESRTQSAQSIVATRPPQSGSSSSSSPSTGGAKSTGAPESVRPPPSPSATQAGSSSNAGTNTNSPSRAQNSGAAQGSSTPNAQGPEGAKKAPGTP